MACGHDQRLRRRARCRVDGVEAMIQRLRRRATKFVDLCAGKDCTAMMAAISQRALAYSSSAICRVFVFSLPVVSLDVEGLACVRKRCGGCVLGCCEQLCVEAKPVLAYFRKPSFCPRLIQNLLHGSVSAPEACIWRRVLGVIKNQYFCRRNLRAAARATDRFTVRGPALLVTSGHLRPRYREISSSGAHRAEISTSSGPTE